MKNIKFLFLALLFINNNFNLIRIINLNEKEDFNYFLNNYYKDNSIKKSEYRWNVFYYNDFLEDLIIKNIKKIKNINNYFLLEYILKYFLNQIMTKNKKILKIKGRIFLIYLS